MLYCYLILAGYSYTHIEVMTSGTSSDERGGGGGGGGGLVVCSFAAVVREKGEGRVWRGMRGGRGEG